ncbi:unnamed protein product [Rhizophagus irregularis]|nr:unnamed protein product [Rhizophagus irregularis]
MKRSSSQDFHGSAWLEQDLLWLGSFQAWLGADLQAEPSQTVARIEPAHVGALAMAISFFLLLKNKPNFVDMVIMVIQDHHDSRVK